MSNTEKMVQKYKNAEKSSKIAKGALVKHQAKSNKNSIWNKYKNK